MARKLKLSTQQRMLAGVCGGLAEWINMDVTVVRLLFVLAVFLLGLSLWIYPILWIVMAANKDY